MYFNKQIGFSYLKEKQKKIFKQKKFKLKH